MIYRDGLDRYGGLNAIIVYDTEFLYRMFRIDWKSPEILSGDERAGGIIVDPFVLGIFAHGVEPLIERDIFYVACSSRHVYAAP